MDGWRKNHGTWSKVWGRGRLRMTANVTKYLPESAVYPNSIHIRIDSEHKDGDVSAVLVEVAEFVKWLRSQ